MIKELCHSNYFHHFKISFDLPLLVHGAGIFSAVLQVMNLLLLGRGEYSAGTCITLVLLTIKPLTWEWKTLIGP